MRNGFNGLASKVQNVLKVAQFAYDRGKFLSIFDIKLNGTDFFFLSKHVSSPEIPGHRPHPRQNNLSLLNDEKDDMNLHMERT